VTRPFLREIKCVQTLRPGGKYDDLLSASVMSLLISDE